MFAALEEKVKEYWDELTGDARAELEKALADVRAEAGQIAPLVTQFRSDLTTLVKDTEPELKSAATTLTDKLASDLAGIIKL